LYNACFASKNFENERLFRLARMYAASVLRPCCRNAAREPLINDYRKRCFPKRHPCDNICHEVWKIVKRQRLPHFAAAYRKTQLRLLITLPDARMLFA
jgi:hypothetical protein